MCLVIECGVIEDGDGLKDDRIIFVSELEV